MTDSETPSPKDNVTAGDEGLWHFWNEKARKLAEENSELRAGIKRLSDEEELRAETTGDDPFSMVYLAAKLAAVEHDLAGAKHVAKNALSDLQYWRDQYKEHMASYQERVAAAHHALFHDDPTDVAERVARFAEEANETLQAFGMSREDMHRLVDYSCDRPVGEPAKEIGAALLTLASLCVVSGHNLMECGEADLEKLQRPETIARIRAKRATRHGRGPLPGFDPATTEGSDR